MVAADVSVVSDEQVDTINAGTTRAVSSPTLHALPTQASGGVRASV